MGIRPRYSQILKAMTTDKSRKVNGCMKKDFMDDPNLTLERQDTAVIGCPGDRVSRTTG
jgi:hypothetical protein